MTAAEGATADQVVERAPHYAEEWWVSFPEITAIMAPEEVVEAIASPRRVLEAGEDSEAGIAGKPQSGITCPSDPKKGRQSLAPAVQPRHRLS